MLRLTDCPRADDASALVDHLLVHGIEGRVRGEQPWEVWVLDHDRIEEARGRLASWSTTTADADDRRRAAKIRRERQRDDDAAGQRTLAPQRRWSSAPALGLGPVTIFLVVVAVLVGFASGFGDPTTMTIQNLSIEPWGSTEFLGRVQRGEVWRLLTPMFIHFGIFHLVFNLLWIVRFGAQIEHHHGSAVALLVVVASELPGSIGQYLVSGPNFGGLSGVVYGMFGFVWMHARYDRRRHYVLADTDSLLIMLWFVACATGLFGPIANVGHAGGLLAGLILGLPPYVRQLRAHAQSPEFAGDDWASVHVKGVRRLVRKWVTPYVPLWFVLIAAVVIAIG